LFTSSEGFDPYLVLTHTNLFRQPILRRINSFPLADILLFWLAVRLFGSDKKNLYFLGSVNQNPLKSHSISFFAKTEGLTAESTVLKDTIFSV